VLFLLPAFLAVVFLLLTVVFFLVVFFLATRLLGVAAFTGEAVADPEAEARLGVLLLGAAFLIVLDLAALEPAFLVVLLTGFVLAINGKGHVRRWMMNSEIHRHLDLLLAPLLSEQLGTMAGFAEGKAACVWEEGGRRGAGSSRTFVFLTITYPLFLSDALKKSIKIFFSCLFICLRD